jgi:large subunit ribosomal protein L1
MRVLALVPADKEAEAKAAGADFVGLDDYIEKIKGGWTDIDVIVTVPQVMGKLGALGRVLGPRGLMPNPKTGTVTMDIGKAVTEAKGGKIDFKVDKAGIIHAGIGKVSFDAQKLAENANELLNTIVKLKPSSAKGAYVKSVYMSSTMSAGIALDTKSFN